MQNPNKPIWFGEQSIVETIDLSDPKPESKSPHKIMVCTPVHSECSICLLYTSPSPRDKRQSRMPSSA